MAPLQYESPGCSKKVEEQDIVLAIELLSLHDTQAHGIANKLKAFCIVNCCIENLNKNQFRDKAKTLLMLSKPQYNLNST